MRARTALLALWAALAASPAVFAQSISPLEPPDLSRYLKWGPFRVRPGLTIPNLGYDNNVFYRPDESTLPAVGDYFIALAPRVEGVVLFGHRAFLTFDERIEFYAYASESDLDYFNQFGRARVTVPFRRFGVYADFGYNRIRDRPIDSQDARPVRKEIPVGGGLILKIGWRTDAEIGVTRSTFTGRDADDPTIGPRIDRVETGTRVGARYLAFGRTRVPGPSFAREPVCVLRSVIMWFTPATVSAGLWAWKSRSLWRLKASSSTKSPPPKARCGCRWTPAPMGGCGA
jgi:hypothetical protein